VTTQYEIRQETELDYQNSRHALEDDRFLFLEKTMLFLYVQQRIPRITPNKIPEGE
jgi:hypothetical protein